MEFNRNLIIEYSKIVKPKFPRKTTRLCRILEIEGLPKIVSKTQDRTCFKEDKLCFVIYAVQDNVNINVSPASLLLSVANEETQADNRGDHNTADETPLSSGVYKTFHFYLIPMQKNSQLFANILIFVNQMNRELTSIR